MDVTESNVPAEPLSDAGGDSFAHEKWHTRVLADAKVARIRRGHWRLALRSILPVVALLCVVVGAQYWRTTQLVNQLNAADRQVAVVSEELRRLRSESPLRSEMDVLRDTVKRNLDGESARVDAIESGSLAPVVAQVSASVGLIQGRFVLIHPTSGKPVRVRMALGKPMRDSDGSPRLTISGMGPVYVSTFMGTFFVIDQHGSLLTNRHVALPWENGIAEKAMKELGVKPVMLEMRGFLPGQENPFEVMTLTVDSHDLALLRGSGAALSVSPLPLAKKNPLPGDVALLFGYPTGIHALIARAGDEFLARLENVPNLDDGRALEILAKVGLVKPLVSRGIIAQTTDAAIAYDAQTTGGGSGGPVVNLRGEVVAVNRAVLQNFTGSNIGVPIEVVSELLKQTSNATIEIHEDSPKIPHVNSK
ncbi:trypsin-like peptidase domain-containing protein [Rhodoferax sp. GW822-FHT02A01]|uniref:trypsin-like peptidase domain-containing protein n=1 Tax=Rhodoferax sp. GW822-FHT02A01 TaxID=3141537 RepID=UPI00315DFA6D